MRPTQHHQDLGLVARPPGAEPEGRRPRGHSRGRRPDPGLEVRFDPRLELAEQLLHRREPTLLRQVHNLLEDARADHQRPGVPEQRPGAQNPPALLVLDELLLSMREDESTSRAKRATRIMEARRLLHRVDEETADPRWPGTVRRRKLQEIIDALSVPPDRDGRD
jgi:hypothetical protein